MRICVTGASGKVGRATVEDLRAHGHEVTAVDLVTVREHSGPMVVGADLTDATQAAEVLKGMDAVVHVANHPAPDLVPPTRTFTDNVTMNFNVLNGAVAAGLSRVVWASSETTLGLPFSDIPPEYVPVDEQHYPRSTTAYALSKVVSEAMAVELNRWSQIPMVALRFSNVYELHEYELLPALWDDIHSRDFNLWAYIDVRDAASSCRMALEAEVSGAESAIIAAADTIMTRSTRELLAERFPDVPVRRELGEFETLLSIDRARELLAWEPAHSWRDEIAR
ncbi:MAG: NAD(P)-dependent oxidoreductase [Solirubrobacterales bacterium]|nr:NAD(P)-dependent oxidoreductase [Solirubrobacterales bacterium]